MDIPPALDCDTSTHTPHSASIPYHTGPGSAAHSHSHSRSPHGQEHSMQPQHHQQAQAHSQAPPAPSSVSQPKFSNGPHIRSRITVVCAECKRLKLKCDRRTPCSSCLKRDTVTRCIYSQAAAEKIDVQSLHNRILNLEGTLAKLSSASPSSSVSSILGNLPSFKMPFSASISGGFSPVNGTGIGSSGNISQLHGQPSNDRALLAIGSSGSSVVISLDDVASIWLNELDDLNGSFSEATAGPSSGPRVKLEPTPVIMPPTPSVMFATTRGHACRARLFVPPIPYETFLLSASPLRTHVTTSTDLFPSVTPPSPRADEPPQVTPTLLDRLPPPEHREKYLRALSETMMLHPCFNVRHFEQRVGAMCAWGEVGPSAPAPAPAGGNAYGGSGPAGTMKALAHELFFGAPPKPGKHAGGREAAPPRAGAPKPTLSFFAAAAAALALGALVSRDADAPSPPPDAAGEGENAAGQDGQDHRCSPAALFALSEQALGLYERTALYDLDMLITMILQILYQLHDGQMSVAQGVFPLVGKMINVARMMGLAIDPDEFPGTYSLFEAETRRRIWWDVFYYDLFVSDCMGHPPLIADNSFTTRMPAEVDEEHFNPSSMSLPVLPAGESLEKGTQYFVLKCRLAQLVKNAKKLTFRDPLAEDPSELAIEQAAAFEADASGFLSELPPAFRLDLDHDWAEPAVSAGSMSPVLQAQKCELAILANRLILKLYLPLLKDCSGNGGSKPTHQAVLSAINAAHMVIYASRMLHAVWRQTRPAAFEFYDFQRTLFDAAVVCAHAVIQQPSTLLAAEAIKSVAAALDVMRDLGPTHGEGSRGEAVRIVEMMKRKAEAARMASSGSGATTGMKRKRSPLEDERLSSGFQLPFVGASVSSLRADPPRPPAKAMNGIAKEAPGHESKSKSDTKRQAKEKDRTAKLSPVGIRARPPPGPPGPAGPPTSRQRTGSVSSNAPPPSTPSGRAELSPAGSMPPSASTSQSTIVPSQSTVSQSSSVNGGYGNYSTRATPTPAHEPPPRDEYQMHYSSGDESNMVERRRFSSQSYADSPKAASLFDQASMQYPSPASYGTPPYYHQYPPPQGPPSGFEGGSMPPPTSLPPMGGLPPPPPPPMPPIDTQPGGGGMPMSAMPHGHAQYLSYEKASYESHMNRPPEHTRQLTHEYQPPPNPQSMSMSSSHGWLPPDANGGNDMWHEYKYIG